ncbi:MAG: formate dehydrogenase accessory sulfurtransferase FdhD [Candidatus Bathyarchaeota archaeon]|nr:MAG: formate dehydrogenase accessory sulfurtransferase FdhD [Candidatus Bathyarchaeota archaeon]
MTTMIKDVSASRIDVVTGQVERRQELVAKEAPLHIFIGGIHLVSILCSPTSKKELVVGHLFSEGMVADMDEIVNLRLERESVCRVTLRKTDAEERGVISKPFSRLVVSACGSADYESLAKLLETIDFPSLPSSKVDARIVLKCVKQLNFLAQNFRRTGGVHAAALFKHDGNLVVFAEDVGRHNAVDKVFGASLLQSHDINSCFLASSGRLTADIVMKAARMKIPIVASLSAPVDSGVDVAERAGLTLIGFVRGNRMNVYANPERIRIS